MTRKCRRRSMRRRACRRPTWWISEIYGEFLNFWNRVNAQCKSFWNRLISETARVNRWWDDTNRIKYDVRDDHKNHDSLVMMMRRMWRHDKIIMPKMSSRSLWRPDSNPLQTFCKHNGDVLMVMPIWLCCSWWWWCADNDEHGKTKFLASRVWKDF